MYSNDEIKKICQDRINMLQEQINNVENLAKNFRMTEEKKQNNLNHWNKEIKKAQKRINNLN